MKKKLLEEINKMRFYFDYKPGKIISEQKNISLLKEQNENEKVLEKTINFDSGKWSAEAGNIKGILDPQMAEIQEFLKKNGASSKLVTIVLAASESQVPNYDGEAPDPKKAPLQPKELSKRRYTTIETYMKGKLSEWQEAGLIPTNPAPKIEKLEPIIGGPKWNPPANATSDQIKQLVNSKQYRDHQNLRMFIKVTTTDDYEIPANAFVGLKTYREKISNTPGNEPFFYGYSMAAAAVMGVDYKTLPSQLLTMNKYFGNKLAITIPGPKNILIPTVTINIEPDSDNIQDVVVSDRTANGLGYGQAWKAKISDTYRLIIPYKPGTIEYEGAWIFAYYYLTGPSQLDDWNRISNKPTDVKFLSSTKIKRDTVSGLESLAGQIEYFKPGGVFVQGLVDEEWIEQWYIDRGKPFKDCYRGAVNLYYKDNPKEEEESEK